MTNLLDHFRHWVAYIFNPDVWGGNLSENLIWWAGAAVIAYCFYPPFKKWIKTHYDRLHDKLDRHARMLQHIIENHPDLPPFEETK